MRIAALTLCILLLGACLKQRTAVSPTPDVLPIETGTGTVFVLHMRETLLEMEDDYRNAVSLHQAMEQSAGYQNQHILIGKYIDFLLPAIEEMETLVDHAEKQVLTEKEREHYQFLRFEWLSKSTTVFGAVGRTL